MRRVLALTSTALLFALSGCDLLGIEPASAVAARQEAEGKAIGAGCRHAARSIEVCYEMNRRADKAAVFAGWRDMNDYMRENKIEAQPPAPVAAADGAAEEEEAPAAPAGTAKTVAHAGKGDKGEKADKADKAEKGAAKPAKGAKPAH